MRVDKLEKEMQNKADRDELIDLENRILDKLRDIIQ
jgi:hypothetical protein